MEAEQQVGPMVPMAVRVAAARVAAAREAAGLVGEGGVEEVKAVAVMEELLEVWGADVVELESWAGRVEKMVAVETLVGGQVRPLAVAAAEAKVARLEGDGEAGGE